MGSSQSKSKPSLDREYKLIRRFVSDLYDGSEVTVIEHKQTREQFVLKQLIQQFSSQKLVKELQAHRSHSHNNLVSLRRYWLQNDVNICSSLFKVYAVFDHHDLSLEEWLEDNRGEVSDREAADFVKQMSSVLTFLERNRVHYLLSGPKSIAVTHESRNKQSQSFTAHHRSASKFTEETSVRGRFSLGGEHLWQCQEPKLDSKKDSCDTVMQPSDRRVYKVFDPFDRGTASRSFPGLTNHLQVPAHPSLKNYGEHTLLPQETVREQNMLTVGLIALSMCEGGDFVELDIYKKGRLSMEKYKARVAALKAGFPRTFKELQRWQGSGSQLSGFSCPIRMSQFFRIKDVSLLRQRKESKENAPSCENASLERSWKLSSGKKNQRSMAGLLGKTSKRISLAQL